MQTSSCVLLFSIYFTAFYTQNAAADPCPKLPMIQECARQYHEYISAGAPTIATTISKFKVDDLEPLCSGLGQMKTCLDGKMANCDGISDGDNYIVKSFNRFIDDGAGPMCADKDKARQVLGKIETCFTDAVIAELNACDKPDSGSRRRRRATCSEIQEEIRCVDGVLDSKCNDDEVEKLVGGVVRRALRETEATVNCDVPSMGGNPQSNDSSALGVWSTAVSAVSVLCTLYHVYSAV